LIISDVPGDDPAFIGSGPTVGDPSTPDDALAVIERWKVEVPVSVREALSHGSGVVQPGDPRLARTRNVIYAAPRQSLEAAASLAREAGCDVRLLGDALEGEAREVAATQAREALALQRDMKPGDPPIVLLSGGELTVTRRGDGIGGPNAEFCLALALELDGAEGIHALACDTDGVDGAAEVAGAVIGPSILRMAEECGGDPHLALERNDAHSFFSALGAQVVTGPTLTNVNDFRAIFIQA
jgi:hydroxypyruvate reductase